jgi:hypothetical protein
VKDIVEVEELRGRDNRPSLSRSAATSVTFAGGTTHSKSRPGTADTYLSHASSLRNHRVESLRAVRSVPPTRESSPSRSVRFDVSSSNARKNSAGFSDFDPIIKDGSRTTSPINSPLASAQTSRAPSPAPGYPKQR